MTKNRQLAAIHVAKKQLRLDDATYRDLVLRVSAKFRRSPVDSSGLMDGRERVALLDELRRFGFRRVEPQRPAAPGGPQEAKIRALWAALRDAGALRQVSQSETEQTSLRGASKIDDSERALRAFIRRQTGRVEVPQWLTAEQANKVIEGLKAWHARAQSKQQQA